MVETNLMAEMGFYLVLKNGKITPNRFDVFESIYICHRIRQRSRQQFSEKEVMNCKLQLLDIVLSSRSFIRIYILLKMYKFSLSLIFARYWN